MTLTPAPRPVITVVTLLFVGCLVYNLVTAGDYRVTAALALAVLLLLGVDVGSVLRAWTGAPAPEPPATPPAPIPPTQDEKP